MDGKKRSCFCVDNIPGSAQYYTNDKEKWTDDVKINGNEKFSLKKYSCG